MGQVIGFSHCKEFGTVNSTPDSTPSCSDGGNEESDFPELQTAREWSEDEEGPDIEDTDECLSSSSIWGTPRQNSFELTFSYIALSESDCSPRRDSGRRRAGGRGSRGLINRTDITESQLPPDSPFVDWDPHSYLSVEGEGDAEQENLLQTLEPSAQDWMEEFQEKDSATCKGLEEISGIQMHSLKYSHQDESSTVPHPHGSDPSVATETTANLQTVDPSYTTAPAIGRNTQEEQICDLWYSTLNLSEWTTDCLEIAVMDLIYWKDMERTGVVFTGLVVGLLALFQLSIITVVSTLSLAIMCFTISVRIYYKLLHVLQLGDGVNPFQSYLDLDISLKEEAQHFMEKAILLACHAVDTLRNLIFVSNLFNSLKFLLLMYLVTYLGNLCNGLTLLIISVIAVFSVPLVYSRHQDKVDSCFAAVQAHIDNMKDFFCRLAQGGGPPPDPTPGGAKPKAQ